MRLNKEERAIASRQVQALLDRMNPVDGKQVCSCCHKDILKEEQECQICNKPICVTCSNAGRTCPCIVGR